MSEDILVRQFGHAGWLTLNRPQALNALSRDMCLRLEDALESWQQDEAVQHVVIEGIGERAFSAGGDIAKVYEACLAGHWDFARQYLADEYRLNAKIHHYPKPYIAFMQGFSMGGGVGVSCHGSHRIVGESSRLAMPECGIGLVPDVGGSLLLAQAPGSLGEYLGMTGRRMTAGEAIFCGFANHYIPESLWSEVKRALQEQSVDQVLRKFVHEAPPAPLAECLSEINAVFGQRNLAGVFAALSGKENDFSQSSRDLLSRGSPLSMACCQKIVREVRLHPTIENAVDWEYRFTARAAEWSDFLEGVRAAIIDKDRRPKWRFVDNQDGLESLLEKMLAPL